MAALYEYPGFAAHGDSLKLETSFKSDFTQNFKCYGAFCTLIGENYDMRVHLVKSGCTSMVSLQTSKVWVWGKTNDLSAFGRDLSQWQQVRVEIKQKLLLLLRRLTLYYTNVKYAKDSK